MKCRQMSWCAPDDGVIKPGEWEIQINEEAGDWGGAARLNSRLGLVGPDKQGNVVTGWWSPSRGECAISPCIVVDNDGGDCGGGHKPQQRLSEAGA